MASSGTRYAQQISTSRSRIVDIEGTAGAMAEPWVIVASSSQFPAAMVES